MRVKRTYNLDEATVLAVRELVEQRGLASSQDALVEQALSDLILAVRYADEAERFAQAAQDPALAGELSDLDREFGAHEPAWPE